MRHALDAFLVVGVALAFPAVLQAQSIEQGRDVYERWCASCHGVEGDGLGPAAGYMIPRPRDFTRGLYQIRTTPGGELPTDDDLLHVINEGMPGSTMPGWQDQLSSGDREALVAYLKSFYPPFETLGAPEPLEFSQAPEVSEERIAEGRIFYDSIECWQCHGAEGRGDGTSGPELADDWGYPIRAVDLTKNWRFNGGGTVEDIYRRLRTGLDGSPMPAFSDLIDAGFMTDDQLWNLAHFVRSLAPEQEPRVREVVLVERVEPGEVPSEASDSRWDEVDSFYVPLVGQVIVSPRWFDPSVSAVWVQGIHDGSELALRLTWTDRSRSPDPSWLEWQAQVLETMEPKEGPAVEPGARPDRITVQFPPAIPEGMERPYFLKGDASNPVYLWRWSSDPLGAEKALARGIDDVQSLGSDGLSSDAVWDQGQWQLVLRRGLESADPGNELQFEVGQPIPVAFFAWDGDNAEEGTRGSISSWFFVYLGDETPPSTYVTPLVAFLLTGGMGLFVVRRAQRRERDVDSASADPASVHLAED